MKCECGNEFIVRVGSKVDCKNCKVLTNSTVILTVQCDVCKKVKQVPVQSQAFMSVNKDDR
jgi:hypothetical protein